MAWLISLTVFAVLAIGVRSFLLDTFGVFFTNFQFAVFFAAAFAYLLYRRRQSRDIYADHGR